MNKSKYILKILLLFFVGVWGCGEGSVDLNDIKYEPKIVVDAMIYPEKPVKDIKISRNFPLNKQFVDKSKELFIADASVKIFDNVGNSYILTFNSTTQSYEYLGSNLKIEYGKTYSIVVDATIDGKKLETSCSTLTPEKGFSIIKNEGLKNNDTIIYRKGVVPSIYIKPSHNTTFYAMSTYSLNANESTFITDNVFGAKYKDIAKDDNNKHRYNWLQNVNYNLEKVSQNFDWLDYYYYGKYRLVVYATDVNYQNFLVTNTNLQEMDGNFHEPRLSLKGDGVGYFGSAICDTIYYFLK